MAGWLRRLWNAVKPPPAPRKPYERIDPTLPPWYKTFWKIFSPPPKVDAKVSAAGLEAKRRRRRFVLLVFSVAVAAGSGWQAHLYISSASSRADKAYQRGLTLMGKGDLPGAERQFTNAIDTSPELKKAFLDRGLARLRLQDTDGAAADFDRAIALDPNLQQAHTELALIYRERGNADRALSELTLSIQIAPSTDALYQRGQLYESLGQHQKAIEDYDAAIREQVDAPFVYRARATSREALGDHDGAENDRQTAASIEQR